MPDTRGFGPDAQAEITMERILNTMQDGKFKGRFVKEWSYGKKWKLHFFFQEVRIGIQIDSVDDGTISQMKTL